MWSWYVTVVLQRTVERAHEGSKTSISVCVCVCGGAFGINGARGVKVKKEKWNCFKTSSPL